jgi:hypothetical protein
MNNCSSIHNYSIKEENRQLTIFLSGCPKALFGKSAPKGTAAARRAHIAAARQYR